MVGDVRDADAVRAAVGQAAEEFREEGIASNAP
jgi:hypothetical protein